MFCIQQPFRCEIGKMLSILYITSQSQYEELKLLQCFVSETCIVSVNRNARDPFISAVQN